ncbi:MAG: hypothetical protein ACPG8W_09390 [Candidatus Promineifilaceae bacterium]
MRTNTTYFSNVVNTMLVIALLLSNFVMAGAVEAATPPLSGSGTATIDGVFSPGEWANAGSKQFYINNFYPGPGVLMTLYVMNDQNNVYFALEHAGGGAGLYYSEGANISLDRNRSHVVPDIGDDQWDLFTGIFPPTGQYVTTFDDQRITACNPNSYCTATSDTALGGTLDGSGAIANDGTRTVYEFSHPLNTSDNANDVSLKRRRRRSRIKISGLVTINASPIQLQAQGEIPVTRIKIK